SDRMLRQLERLLDQAEEATDRGDWATVRDRAEAVLRVDPQNHDALSYLAMAGDPAEHPPGRSEGDVPIRAEEGRIASERAHPTSFCDGRYQVKRFLGEGGKKLVYLAHDRQLDRDVAFALIKTEGLDDAGRQRIQREAQAMG